RRPYQLACYPPCASVLPINIDISWSCSSSLRETARIFLSPFWGPVHAGLHLVSETTQRSLVACSPLDVAARRLLERGQAALPRHARRHLGARQRRQPLVPLAPP